MQANNKIENLNITKPYLGCLNNVIFKKKYFYNRVQKSVPH